MDGTGGSTMAIDAEARLPRDSARLLQQCLDELERARLVERVWRGDHTVWQPDPREVADRLGWLRLPAWSSEQLPNVLALRDEVLEAGFTDLLLMGMGGASLAAAVFATLGEREAGLRFHLLDSTNPEEVVALEERLDLRRTLFVVASKSGTTVETRSHLAYFLERVRQPAQFVAITDEGTPLARVASEKGFRRLFLNPTDVGGRYSALSHFGLVPAAVCGVRVEPLLDAAQTMAHACHASPAENPGAWLGAVLGLAARNGRDKLHLLMPAEASPFGAWVEQLVAESTGKDGKGILPLLDHGLPERPEGWADRLVVAQGCELPAHPPDVPAVRLGAVHDGSRLGAELFRWEFATAVAGYFLGINPFDQPNVQEAKDATAKVLRGELSKAEAEPPLAVLAAVQPGWYIALLAWVSESDEHVARLNVAADALRARTGCPVTVGFGPRYLHSTGQLHKGGSERAAFIQVVGRRAVDIPVPGERYTFGELYSAQAEGDLASLRARGRRVARVTLEELESALGC